MKAWTTRHSTWLVVVVGVLAWLIHVTAPSDMFDDDQIKPAAYVLDIVRNGAWLVQTDFTGDIASKPPLYQWLAAPGAFLLGVGPAALYIPSGIGLVVAALVACRLAGDRFGPVAGGAAGIMMILNSLAAKHICLARSDALLTGLVALTAMAGLLAWERGSLRSWTIFWMLAAWATMTKGPVGLVLGGSGLLAALWEGRAAPVVRMKWHLPGVALFLLICGGWFTAAVYSHGQPVIDKLIGRELVGHAVNAESGKGMLSRPHLPLLYFLARFMPWSPIAVLSLIRVVLKPGKDDGQRRLERWCVCWLVGGLVLFAIPGHQRADLLLPLFPAASVLVGRAFAERTAWMSGRALRVVVACAILLGLTGIAVWNHELRLKDRDVKISLHAESVARTMKGLRVGFSPEAAELQYAFRVKQAAIGMDQGMQQVREGLLDAFIVRSSPSTPVPDSPVPDPSLQVEDLGWGWSAIRRIGSERLHVPTSSGSSPAVADPPR